MLRRIIVSHDKIQPYSKVVETFIIICLKGLDPPTAFLSCDFGTLTHTSVAPLHCMGLPLQVTVSSESVIHIMLHWRHRER